MSENKNYYYLKLKDNFFGNDEIKVLEAEKDYFTISLYLKLLTKSKHYKRGYRYYDLSKFLIIYKLPELIRVIFSIDKNFSISAALEILQKLELIEIKKGIFIIRDLNIDLDKNRSSKEYKEWRRCVLQRDNFKCQLCGAKGIPLHAHHKKPWAYNKEKRLEIDNGMTLCYSCHKKMHQPLCEVKE